jgi:hypothetical protein
MAQRNRIRRLYVAGDGKIPETADPGERAVAGTFGSVDSLHRRFLRQIM